MNLLTKMIEQLENEAQEIVNTLSNEELLNGEYGAEYDSLVNQLVELRMNDTNAKLEALLNQ